MRLKKRRIFTQKIKYELCYIIIILYLCNRIDNVTQSIFMEEKKSKRGGKRPGAGRPYKTEGCRTVVMRVPEYLKSEIAVYIRMQADMIEDKLDMGFLDELDEKKRASLVDTMKCMIWFEEKRLEQAKNRTEKQQPKDESAKVI